MKVYHGLEHLDSPMDIGSYKAICQSHAPKSSNSAFSGSLAYLHFDRAHILSPNPSYYGFAICVQGWGLHLGWRWFKAIEYQDCKAMSFRLNFSNSSARGYGLEPTTYRVQISIWRFSENATCYLARMCKVPKGAAQACKSQHAVPVRGAKTGNKEDESRKHGFNAYSTEQYGFGDLLLDFRIQRISLEPVVLMILRSGRNL